MHQDVGVSREEFIEELGEAIAEEYMQPCKICGDNTSSKSERCNRCWQIEHRLEGYLTHAAGRSHALTLIAKILEGR